MLSLTSSCWLPFSYSTVHVTFVFTLILGGPELGAQPMLSLTSSCWPPFFYSTVHVTLVFTLILGGPELGAQPMLSLTSSCWPPFFSTQAFVLFTRVLQYRVALRNAIDFVLFFETFRNIQYVFPTFKYFLLSYTFGLFVCCCESSLGAHYNCVKVFVVSAAQQRLSLVPGRDPNRNLSCGSQARQPPIATPRHLATAHPTISFTTHPKLAMTHPTL
jgi:hypothetical protein